MIESILDENVMFQPPKLIKKNQIYIKSNTDNKLKDVGNNINSKPSINANQIKSNLKTSLNSNSTSNINKKSNIKNAVSKINNDLKIKDLKTKIKKIFNPFQSLLNEGDLTETDFINNKKINQKEKVNTNTNTNQYEKSNTNQKDKNKNIKSNISITKNQSEPNKKMLSPISEEDQLILSPENREMKSDEPQLNNLISKKSSDENNNSFDQSNINNDNLDNQDDETQINLEETLQELKDALNNEKDDKYVSFEDEMIVKELRSIKEQMNDQIVMEKEFEMKQTLGDNDSVINMYF